MPPLYRAFTTRRVGVGQRDVGIWRSDLTSVPQVENETSAARTSVERYNGSPAAWDAFVAGQAGSTHCHRYAWRDVMARVFGHECLYLAARRDTGELEGVLPLIRVKSPVFGHFLVSMPFLNYGGPIGSPSGVAALAAAAAALGKRDGVSLLELRNRTAWPAALADGWTVSTRKITVVRDLPAGGGPVLWKQVDGKVRSQVRRPQKEGVEVRFGTDQVAPFFAIFARHMRDLGTPTQSRKLFDALVETFPEDVGFGCAYLGGEPIAGGCGFQWQSEFEMTWASALESHKQIAANMLLYWAFMERAANSGLTAFNFGRCTPDSGTHRFKRQWGTRDEQLWWYGWSPTGSAKTPSPDDPGYAWKTRLWKQLPVPVATVLGPRIVKYIP
jgi:serine/alanine adding enzyme